MRADIALQLFLIALVCNLAAIGQADEPSKSPDVAAKPRELIVDPAAEPVPAFRYHLLPPVETQIVGNAVPIYSRIVHEQNDEWKIRLRDDVDRLNELPLDELSVDEARKVLESLGDAVEQLSAAGRRSHADWEYVIEGQDPLLIRLPDSQFMRAYGRLLVLKARYEIRSGNLSGAAGALEDGMALGRHTASAPFIVNQLIGVVICELMLQEMDNLASQPGAPNFYWALARLPHPLVSFDPGLQTERRILELKFPELADNEFPRSEQDWQRLATALRAWSVEVRAMEQGIKVGAARQEQTYEPVARQKLDQAKVFLVERMQLPKERVEAMSSAEVEVRYCVALYDDVVDDWQKWFFVPYPQSLGRFMDERNAMAAEAKRLELYPLVSVLTPLASNLVTAPARADRKVARQQVIEAVRMHAAANGKLPASLDEVSIVPVPVDPATGAPFRYTLDGEVAVLDLAEEMGMKREQVNLPVRIRLRGK
jgi:hypothetical protein